jgi:hypothetical protein
LQRWHKVVLAIVVVVTLAALVDLFLITRDKVDEPEWPPGTEPARTEQARPEVESGRTPSRTGTEPSYLPRGSESAAPGEARSDALQARPETTDEGSFMPTTSEASDQGRAMGQRGSTALPDSPPPRQPIAGSGGATSGSQRAASRGGQTATEQGSSAAGVAVGTAPRSVAVDSSDDSAETLRQEPEATPLAEEPDVEEGPGRPRPGDRSDEDPPSLATVRMIPSANEPSVGDVVSIVITIDGATQVGHTPFHLHFNPQVLRFEFGAEGSFLGGDGQPTAFFASATSDGGSVVVGLSRLGRVPGIAGSGDLCMLQFSVVGAGNAGLSFARAKVKDPNNQILPAVFQPVAVIAR